MPLLGVLLAPLIAFFVVPSWALRHESPGGQGRVPGRSGLLALVIATVLLGACSTKVTSVLPPSPSPVATLAPSATAAPRPSATAAVTFTAAPVTAVPTATAPATANPAATAAAQARATQNAVQAQAVAHLGAGNTLLQAGNLDGAIHEYATAQALAPNRQDVASSAATAQAMRAATARAQLAAVVPIRLAIPAIGVNAPVELLGLTGDGAMQAPDGWWDAGWYRYGPLPGQTGNAVIAGHLDSTTGPALFWHLTSVSSGASVLVTLSNGQAEHFVVQRQVSYRDDNAPLQEIFGAATTVNLNLITCGGTWDAAQHNYSNRTVLYTRRA